LDSSFDKRENLSQTKIEMGFVKEIWVTNKRGPRKKVKFFAKFLILSLKM